MPALKYDPSLFSDAPDDKPGSTAPVDGPQPYNPALFDDTADIPEPAKKQEKPSVLRTLGREAGGAAAPTAIGIASGSAAAALSAPFVGPFAPVVGLAVGLGSGYAASKAQEKILEAAPETAKSLGQSPEQRQEDEDTNPIATRVGGVLPGLLAFRPTTEAFSLLKKGASEVAKAAGKTALKTGAFNAAVTSGVTAGQQAVTGEYDPEDLAIQTAAGFLGQKPTRLGRMLGGGGFDRTAAVPEKEIAPDQPTSLLALPKPYDVPHTDPRVFTASETGLVSEDPNIRRAAMEAAPQGTQGDLFSLGGEDTTQVPRDPVRPPQEVAPPPDQGGQAPIPMDGAGQPSLFTAKPTAGVAPDFGPNEIRRAVIGGAKPDTFGLKLAQKVHQFLKDGDTVAAADHVQTEADNLEFADLKPATIDARKAQIDRAKTVVSAYTSKMTNAMAEEAVQQPRPEPANNVAPAPVEPSVAAIREDNAARADTEATPSAPAKAPASDADIAHANQVAEDGRRTSILKHVLDDPETISPAKRFAALLKRQNLDPAPRAYEKEEIINHLVRKGRIEDAKTAFKDLTETGHPQDKSGTADLEALIPERKTKPERNPFDSTDFAKNPPEGLDSADMDIKGNRAPLVVARRLPTGDIVYGKPGEIHSDLIKAGETPAAHEAGFAEGPGKPFMSRDEAAAWVRGAKAAGGEHPNKGFKLESQTEGDLQKIEAARVRREGKSERREAAAEAAKPAAVQGEMFTPKGNITKAAMAKRPALPKDEPTKVKPTTKEKSNGNEERGKDAPVRPKKSEDGRQGRQAPDEGRKGQDDGLLEYADVKKRADAAVSARSITPKQHGMVEAAIAAKSHTPAELSKEVDKMLARGAEKEFEGEPRHRKVEPTDLRRDLPHHTPEENRWAANENGILLPKERERIEWDRIHKSMAEHSGWAKAIGDAEADNNVWREAHKRNWNLGKDGDTHLILDKDWVRYAEISPLPKGGWSLKLNGLHVAEKFNSYPEAAAYALGVDEIPRAARAAFGKREPSTEVSSSPRTAEIIKSGGSLHDVLNHIAEASPDPKHRELAQTFSKMLAKNDIKLGEHTAEDKVNHPYTKGLYYKKNNRIAVNLDYSPHEIDTTVLHELVHALTETALDHKTPAGREFEALYNAYQKMAGVGRKFVYNHDDVNSYGFHDVHEFVSELFTNSKFRARLRSIKDHGSPTDLLTRALHIIKRILGLKTTDPLEHLMATEARVYKIDTLKQSLRETAAKRRELREAAGLPEPVRARIEQAPKAQREPLARLARISKVWTTKQLSTVAMGNHLYDMAVNRGIKSARILERVKAEGVAASNALMQPHLRLIEKARELPQDTLKEVNRLIQDSTSKWEFAFHPGYLRDAVPDVNSPGGVKYVPSRKLGIQAKVNPELNARYKALPPAARKVVTEAFRLSYDRLHDEKAAVLQHVNTSYDGLIADATKLLSSTTDIKKRGELTKEITQYNIEKRQALSSYNSLLSIDPNRPYAPLTRNGKWLVTAKSDAYLKAEAAGDTEALSKMQSNPDHYFVDFAGSHGEGFKLADAVAEKYGAVDKNVFVQERNKFADKLYAGRDMTSAVQRLENLARQTDAPPSTRALINELKLKTLTQNSIRRSEMQRLNVAAGDLDMLRNVVSHGRSAAHFIGNLYHAEEVLDALQKVKKEVDYPGGKQTLTGRDDRQAVVNSITARHEMGMNRPMDDDALTVTANKLNALTSVYMLSAKPMYYAQQLMQSWMYSHPMMSARYGYGKASSAMTSAYKTVAKVMADQPAEGLSDKVFGQIDLSKLPDKYRGLADHLYQSGILDVGINTEMGGSNATEGLAATGERVMDKVRGLSRKVEAINRLTAGIAQYDLELANPGKSPTQHDAGAYDAYVRDFDRLKDVQGHTFKPLTKEQFTAADNAMRLVRQSHGDLSMANSPALLRDPVFRVVLQYKKFPLIMAGMMGREIEKSFFNKSLPPMERAVARKTLAFLMGHTALMAGASGTIGYNVAKTLYDYVMSKAEDEPRDMEVDIRKAIGNEAVSDLVLKGAPTLANADLSGSLGMGNLLSIAPYAPAPTDRKTWEKFVMGAMGPFVSGVVPRAYDGVSYMNQGDYYKMAENVTPRGISDAIRAVREKTEGVTNKKGELLVDPENVPTMSSIWRAMGAQSVDQSNRSTASDIKYNQEEYYKDKVIAVKRDYVEATTAEERATARDAWAKLQAERVEHGLKRQPLGDLLSSARDKTKRERATVGGLQYTRRNRAEVEELGDLFGIDDDEETDRDPALAEALK